MALQLSYGFNDHNIDYNVLGQFSRKPTKEDYVFWLLVSNNSVVRRGAVEAEYKYDGKLFQLFIPASSITVSTGELLVLIDTSPSGIHSLSILSV